MKTFTQTSDGLLHRNTSFSLPFVAQLVSFLGVNEW